jgi:hypothetical protein
MIDIWENIYSCAYQRWNGEHSIDNGDYVTMMLALAKGEWWRESQGIIILKTNGKDIHTNIRSTV